MTEAVSPAASIQGSLFDALTRTATDPSGVDTFARYVWQAKQVVRLWLTCLSSGGPHLVICEHVEDITLVYPDQIRFLQLKTRDRGSWSATVMVDHGINSLVRSYSAAREVGLQERSTFELWLEGPTADSPDTVAFEKKPSSASAALRKKIVSAGAKRAWLDDFLLRLVIRPNQPTRAHIDAVAFREIGAMWPFLSTTEMEHLFARLLGSATAAQGADRPDASLHSLLVPVLDSAGASSNRINAGSDGMSALAAQILDRETLADMTSPIPDESFDQVLERISRGSTASMLELKMRAGGASADTIRQVQGLRADAEVQRQMLLASRETAEADLEELARRTLTVANATARRIAMTSLGNSAAGRPADAIAADLLSRPHDLGVLDRRSLFEKDGLSVFGFLGHLSDECRFKWSVA
ncbi:MAG: DUF4297 domain-containing protein [Kineosporiaceae bacterium]|nr:DUF4297 domain-containing protein [Kineosporiaceae bacterium]